MDNGHNARCCIPDSTLPSEGLGATDDQHANTFAPSLLGCYYCNAGLSSTLPPSPHPPVTSSALIRLSPLLLPTPSTTQHTGATMAHCSMHTTITHRGHTATQSRKYGASPSLCVTTPAQSYFTPAALPAPASSALSCPYMPLATC